MSSAFPGYKNVFSDVQIPYRGERTIVPALHTGEEKVTRRLRLEQKSYRLLREMGSRFNQPEDLVVNFSEATFSAVAKCFKVPAIGRFWDASQI